MSRAAGFSLFLDERMRRIFLLGVMSGFPWVLIGSSLSLWLKEDGLSRSAVGWAGLIFAVYAVNFLWAPLVDRLRLPYLTDRLGHRKSWILLMQVLILASLLFWSTLAPSNPSRMKTDRAPSRTWSYFRPLRTGAFTS